MCFSSTLQQMINGDRILYMFERVMKAYFTKYIFHRETMECPIDFSKNSLLLSLPRLCFKMGKAFSF